MSYMNRRQLHPDEARAITVFCILLLAFALAVTYVYGAEAASLKVCYKDVPQDTEDVNLYIDNLKSGDIFPGQMQTAGSICGTLPLPTTVTRGVSKSYTIKAVNVLGEEGPASNAITFRYPTVPGAATLVSVGASVP